MAIALLLWMLAAMALTVSAVVHFSQGDVSMAQLRLQESRAWWLGRGLVHLAVRDQILASLDPMNVDADPESDAPDSETAGDDNPTSNVIFSREYNFGDVSARVTLYPAEGLVSLNTAPPEQLLQLFQVVGGLDVNSAQAAVDGVLAYRDQSSPVTFNMIYNPGFRFVEELLVVPGINRSAYDRLKAWVHVHKTGAVNIAAAPAQLASFFETESGAPAGAATPEEAGDKLTFDNVSEKLRQRASSGGGDVVVALVDFKFNDKDRYRQIIQMSTGKQQLLRVGSVQRIGDGSQ
jgi:type II secretory pathway component PulK